MYDWHFTLTFSSLHEACWGHTLDEQQIIRDPCEYNEKKSSGSPSWFSHQRHHNKYCAQRREKDVES